MSAFVLDNSVAMRWLLPSAKAADQKYANAVLESLPIEVDALTSQQAFTRTLALAQAYGISSYDASYLDLALREGVPLATLDKDLLKAARKANVSVYLK